SVCLSYATSNLWLRPIGLAFAAAHALYTGRAMNGAADALICSAPADIPRHRSIDVRVGGLRFLGEQGGGRHQLSRLAIAALRHLLGNPGNLQRMAGGR